MLAAPELASPTASADSEALAHKKGQLTHLRGSLNKQFKCFLIFLLEIEEQPYSQSTERKNLRYLPQQKYYFPYYKADIMLNDGFIQYVKTGLFTVQS